MNIVLIGFMGTGKTAVGKRLAKRLGWKFVDVDTLVEVSAKMPIAKLFSERGEAVFRRLERRHITRIAHGRHQVVSTGGGAFVNPKNRSLLRASGTVVCLTAKPSVILKRVSHKLKLLPMLLGAAKPLTRIQTLLEQRAPAYAQADLTIDTSHLSIDEIVERLWQQLSPHVCKSWQYLLAHAPELSHRYGGKYIVVVENRIVASGDTQLEAYQHAPSQLVQKQDAGIYYIPLPEESLTAL
ncbi:MAG: shikimate kinase [Candidatus Omnitrophica bacterium]|nr:shikimate kinase [Candidatus Omnitrophota bacterium]